MKLYFAKIGFSFCIVIILFNTSSTASYKANQIPDLPYFDDRTYLGYEYGSAGISIALLEVYSSSNIDNATKMRISSLVENSLEKLWDARIEYEGVRYPAWDRSIEEQYLSVYPGIKYGAPGIIRAFLKIFEITDDSKWLARAEESYWYLSTQAINTSTNPHWPYNFNMPKEDSGVAITDLKYGSTGVLSLGIDLFEVTQNQTYLDHGELIISWLNEISIEFVHNDIIHNIIPWYAIDGSTNLNLPFYTTYGFGIAGIAPHLYQFGLHSQSEGAKNWAMELGRFLVDIQLEDGSWYSASDSQSVVNVGFDNGVAGILNGLFELKVLTNSEEFDSAISRGINWLFTRFFSNSTHVGFSNHLSSNSEIEITNSLYDGNIGILRTLTKLTSFLTTDQLDLLTLTYKWIITSGSFVITNGEDEMLFLFESPNNYQFVDFSYAQGLAGFLSELVNLEFNSVISNEINFNLTRAIIAAINTFDYFQQMSGHWQRQYVIPSGWEQRHFTIFNFSDDDIPLNTMLTELDDNITKNNKLTSIELLEDYYYFIPIVVLLPLFYVIKRKKINR